MQEVPPELLLSASLHPRARSRVSPSPSSGAVQIVTSNQDGKGQESSHQRQGTMGSDTPSTSAHTLSLSLSAVLPPTSRVALGKSLSLYEPVSASIR